MKVEQFDAFVNSKVKNPQLIVDQLSEHKVEVLADTCDLLIKGGHYVDHAKRYAIYNKELDCSTIEPLPAVVAEMVMKQLTPQKADLIHMAVGVIGESAELLDAIQNHALRDQPLDRENVIEELGDLEFYMSRIYSSLGITREQVREHCEAKLNKRYKNGYSDADAALRVDKAEAQPVQLSFPECDDTRL